MPKYAKFVVAALVAALTAVSDLLPIGSAATQWVNLGLALVGALAVYLTPNASAGAAQAEATPPTSVPPTTP